MTLTDWTRSFMPIEAEYGIKALLTGAYQKLMYAGCYVHKAELDYQAVFWTYADAVAKNEERAHKPSA